MGPSFCAVMPPPPLPPSKASLLSREAQELKLEEPPPPSPLPGWLFHTTIWLMGLLMVGVILLAVGAFFGFLEPRFLARATHGQGCRAIVQGWLAREQARLDARG